MGGLLRSSNALQPPLLPTVSVPSGENYMHNSFPSPSSNLEDASAIKTLEGE